MIEINNQEYTQRQSKACEVIRHHLAEIFAKGKCFGADLFDVSITISFVKISADLKNAVIYVHPFGSIDKQRFMQSLKMATPTIRKALTSKINFKFSPNITFYLDKNFDHAEKIENLLQQEVYS